MRVLHLNHPLLLATLITAVGTSACAAKVGSTGQSAAQGVTVAVDPSSADLASGQATQFAAAVTGSADTSVTWQVDEAAGGTVAQDGTYTAPSSAGTFHVRAVSNASPSSSAAATITVSVPVAGTVTISPKTVSVSAGGTVSFTASVIGLAGSGVTWSVQESSGCGSVTTAGVYTSPTSARTCHVVATSASDSTKSDVATVNVTAPIVVTITPASATIDACTTLTLRASVSGTSDQAVAWSVAEGSTGGTVSSGGVYTAPATAGTYHVVAASHASSSVTARATITVKDHVLSVAVNPASASLSVNGTQQFTATVTTSCGSFLATGP